MLCPDCHKEAELVFWGRKFARCHDCHCKKRREWAAKNPNKTKNYFTKWSTKNSDKLKASKRKLRLKTLYGITEKEWGDLLKKQGGLCPICGKALPLEKKKIHLDHDHQTGKLRGLLHSRCNLWVGYYEKFGQHVDQTMRHLGKSICSEILRQRFIVEFTTNKNLYTSDIVESLIKNFLMELSKELHMTPIMGPYIKTVHDGTSGYLMWQESGCQVHAWYQYKFCSVDIYTCKEFDRTKALEIIYKYFDPDQVAII